MKRNLGLFNIFKRDVWTLLKWNLGQKCVHFENLREFALVLIYVRYGKNRRSQKQPDLDFCRQKISGVSQTVKL